MVASTVGTMDKRRSKPLQSKNISLQNKKQVGEIELSERQLQLLNSKRSISSKANKTKDQDPPESDKYHSATASSTSWTDDSSSVVSKAASSSKVVDERPEKFYGQLLKGGEKLYDDTGASWDDSKSKVQVSPSASSSSISPRQKTWHAKSPPKKKKTKCTKFRTNNLSSDQAISIASGDGASKNTGSSGSSSLGSSTISENDRALLRKMMTAQPRGGIPASQSHTSNIKKDNNEIRTRKDQKQDNFGEEYQMPKRTEIWGRRDDGADPNKAVLKRVLERARKKNMMELSAARKRHTSSPKRWPSRSKQNEASPQNTHLRSTGQQKICASHIRMHGGSQNESQERGVRNDILSMPSKRVEDTGHKSNEDQKKENKCSVQSNLIQLNTAVADSDGNSRTTSNLVEKCELKTETARLHKGGCTDNSTSPLASEEAPEPKYDKVLHYSSMVINDQNENLGNKLPKSFLLESGRRDFLGNEEGASYSCITKDEYKKFLGDVKAKLPEFTQKNGDSVDVIGSLWEESPSGYEEYFDGLCEERHSHPHLSEDFFRTFDKENREHDAHPKNAYPLDTIKPTGRNIEILKKYLVESYGVPHSSCGLQIQNQSSETSLLLPSTNFLNERRPSSDHFVEYNTIDESLASSNGKVTQKGTEPTMQPQRENTSVEMSNSVPWSRVKLRSIENTSAESSSDFLETRPTWTNVKLRHVTPIATECGYTTHESIPKSEHTPTSDDDDQTKLGIREDIEIKKESALTTSPFGPAMTQKEKLDDSIYVEYDPELQLPSASISSHHNIILPLRAESALDNPICIVNADLLIKGNAIPSEKKVKVIWKLEKNQVNSMLLDPGNCHVRLIENDVDGQARELIFTNSHDSLRFANAVHGLPISTRSTVNEEDEKVSTISSSEHTESPLLLTQLSQDEQSVLLAYRDKVRTEQKENNDLDKFLKSLHNETEEAFAGGKSGYSVRPSKFESSSLTTEERQKVESYQKMIQLKIPKEAVHHKMERDQVDKRLIDLVLSPGTESLCCPASPCQGPKGTDEDKKRAAPYQKMLKLMVPPEGVRHKMMRDGVEEKIMALVFPTGGCDAERSNVPEDLSQSEENVAQPYRQMLKMKVPKEAVEHKMRKDNISFHIIQDVVGARNSGSLLKSLTTEEKSLASTYQRMLKTNMPKEAIRQRMQKDGMNKNVILYVLGDSNTPPKKSTPLTRKPRNNKGFRWEPLRSGEQLQNSIWAKKRNHLDETKPVVEIEKHVELFQHNESCNNKSKQTQGSEKSKVQMASLIDINRAQNIAISLRGFNEFSFDELCDIIEYLDPYKKVSSEKAPFLRDLLPTASEAKAVKTFTGDSKRLVYAEKWLKRIVHVKRSHEKVKVLSTMASFSSDVTELLTSFQLLKDACSQVMQSEKLPDLLEMVRQIGNRMNEGCDEAAGFKLDFLPRLAQTKGSDKKTTALDLVVMIFAGKDNREALDLSSDFPHCREASRLVLEDLFKDVRLLGKSLDDCRTELVAIEKDMVFRRQQISTETTYIPPANSLEAGYRRIEEFLSQADSLFSDLETQKEDALQFCKELSEFFCETGGERATFSLLSILSEFASNLDKAVQKYDRQQRLAKKKEMKNKNIEEKSKGNSAVSDQGQGDVDPTPKAKSLVLMVNEMLKVAGDKVKEDFTKGISYEDNADERLRQIYEIEKSRAPIFSQLTGSAKKRTLLETIEERQMLHGRNATELALSELARAIKNKEHYVDTEVSTASPVSTTISTNFSQSFDSNIEGSSSLGGPPRTADTEELKVSRESVTDILSEKEEHISSKIEAARSRYINRWTRHTDPASSLVVNDEPAGEILQVLSKSDILATQSNDSQEQNAIEERRKQYISRWTRKDKSCSDSGIIDLSNVGIESDSSLDDTEERTRQRYLSRWGNRGASAEALNEAMDDRNPISGPFPEHAAELDQTEGRWVSKGPSPEDAAGRSS